MGNCSLKGATAAGECHTHNSIRVLTDSGAVLDFKGPITAQDILKDRPGYGVFRQGLASTPLAKHENLTSGRMYYLLPLRDQEQMLWKNGEIEKLEADWVSEVEPGKKSSDAALEIVENLGNGSALEVLPSAGDGVWRVKLVIDTKQLEEILSEQLNTEALIEKMRMAASSANQTPKRTKSGWGMGWKPTLTNLFKVHIDNGK